MLELLRKTIDAQSLLSGSDAQRYARGKCKIVVAPGSRDEAAALFRLAAQESWSIFCAGSGTRSRHMHDEYEPNLIVTTSRLNAITEYEPADLVLTAQAGASLAGIVGATQPHNQFLALDPMVPAQSTIGGVVATAVSGPLRFAHGTPRDHVLGLEVIAGDGRVLHFGGKVVKNVAGYDVVRPIVGSRGTLALITEVSVRLRPIPEADRTVVVAAATFAAAADVAAQIIAARLDTVALEIVSPNFALALANDAWLIIARLHGNAEAVADSASRIDTIASGASRNADGELWNSLAVSEHEAPWLVRFAHLPARIQRTAEHAAAFASQAFTGSYAMAAHAGDGIVRLLGDQVAADFGEFASNARDIMRADGGTLMIERSARRVALRPIELEGAALSAGIKRVFDPAGILESLAV